MMMPAPIGALQRSNSRWLWLMADLSLDRADNLLPVIEFPAVDRNIVKLEIRSVGESLSPGTPYFPEIHRVIFNQLDMKLSHGSQAVEEWLLRFPCDDESSRPALNYWYLRFLDFFIIDPTQVPEGVDPRVWSEFRAAFRCERGPNGSNLMSAVARSELAAINAAREAAMSAIEAARAGPLSSYDLDLYARFGWNDHGLQKGLGSLELGARLMWFFRLWGAFSRYISHDGQAAIVALAREQDLEAWQAARSDAFLESAASVYGHDKEEFITNLLPMPGDPPQLELLCE